MDEGNNGVTFGDRLRQLREASGLSQEELAERAGLTAKGIAALERGRSRRPYPQTLRALANALGLEDAARTTFFAAVSATGTPRGAIGAELPSSPASLSPLTPLIGRTAEIEAIVGSLRAGTRLLTLTGPGGVGKTRLALAVMACLAEFPDGVVFVPLAPLADASLVVATVAGALGLRETGEASLRDTLQAWLRGRRMLLVLDNCEHLLAATPDIAALLANAPGLAILATSRAPLRVRGEHEWPVPPLAVPQPAATAGNTAEIAAADAVRLFVARAQAVVPTFVITQGSAPMIAAICRRLDGLPLALELAAARLRLLPLPALLARLDAALPLLAGGARDLPERQRTMSDTIAWSYDLLSPIERTLFRRLAVFAGGWTMEAAEALAAGSGIRAAYEPIGDLATEIAPPLPRATVLDALTGLVEQSLVVMMTSPAGEGPRYRLLEPVRQYALERARASGESESIHARHAAYYGALAERAGPELFAADQAHWLDRLEAEHDNLRAALGWLLAHDRLDAAVRMGWRLHRFWWIRGHLAEGARWLDGVMRQDAALPAATRALALLTAGCVAYALGDHDGSATYLAEAATLARESGDNTLLAPALGLLGLASLGQGEPSRIRAWLDETLGLAEESGDGWVLGMVRNGQGFVALEAGDHDEAERLLGLAAAAWDAIGSTWDVAVNLSMRAGIAARRGDHATVAALSRASLQRLVALRDRWTIAHGLTLLGNVAMERGRAERGARLLGAAAALREATGTTVLFAPDRVMREQLTEGGRAPVDPAAFAAAWSAGRTLPLATVIAEALDETRLG